VNSKLYDAARKSQITFEQIDDLLHFSAWRTQYSLEERSSLSLKSEQWLLYAFGKLKDEGTSAQFASILIQYNMDAARLVPYHCGLIDGVAFPDT
jgi:hypothetical protein